MSPKLHRPAGARYQVVVTEISDHGGQVTYEHTGDAYVAAVATLTGTRITIADVDHDGDPLLRERLVAHNTTSVHKP